MLYVKHFEEWQKSRLHTLYQRADFSSLLFREATGRPTGSLGVAQDFGTINKNYQSTVTNSQLQASTATTQNLAIVSSLTGSCLFTNTGTIQSFSAASTLAFAVSGNSIGALGPSEPGIPAPYNGTLKNMHCNITVNNAVLTTYTLTLFKNGVATALSASVPIGPGAFTINISDTTHTVSVLTGDQIDYHLSNNTGSGTIIVLGFSLEYDRG